MDDSDIDKTARAAVKESLTAQVAKDYSGLRWTTGIEPGFVTDENGGRVCDYRPWGRSAESAECYGQLLATAPRLLVALCNLLADARDAHEDNNRQRTFDGWDAEGEPRSFAEALSVISEALSFRQ